MPAVPLPDDLTPRARMIITVVMTVLGIGWAIVMLAEHTGTATAGVVGGCGGLLVRHLAIWAALWGVRAVLIGLARVRAW